MAHERSDASSRKSHSKTLEDFNRQSNEAPHCVSRIKPVPLWSIFQSILILFCLSALCGVTALHWGGMYDSIAVPVMLCGIVLWAMILILALQSYPLKHRIGDWLDLLVLAWLAYAYFSFTQTNAGYVARIELMWIWTYAGAFLAARYGIHSRNWMIGWLIFLVAIASAVCLFALTHRNNPTYPIWGLPRPDYGARISGTFGCPNHFANFMALNVFVAFLLGTYSRFPWPLRIFFFYLSSMFTLGIFLSVSRGGYLAWIFGMTVITAHLFRTVQLRWWWKAGTLLTLLSGIVVTISRNDFVLGRLEKTLSGDIRLQLIVDSIQIWKNNKLFGTGMASFDFFHMRLPGFNVGRAIYTHNDYLNTLSDYGTIGLTLVLLFMLGYCISLVICGFTLRSEREALLWRIGFCAIAAMAIHEVVDFNLHIPACALTFFALIGMSLSRTFRQQASRRYWFSAAPLLAAAALFMFFVISPLILKTWSAIRLAHISDEELLLLPPEKISRQADLVYQTDPLATTNQTKFGDALRVIAAREYSHLKSEGSRSLTRHRKVNAIARKAIDIYDRVYENNPLDDTLLIKKAMTYDSIGQYNAASLFYAQALNLRPNSSNFHYAIGHHFLRMGDYPSALESFKKAATQGVMGNPNIKNQVIQSRRMIKKIEQVMKQKS